VAAGRDPAGDRKRQAAATLQAERAERAKREEEAFTVAALIEAYAAKHVATLRPATQRDVLSRLRLHLTPIKTKPAVAIARRDAARVVDRAEAAGQTTARRVRDYARAMWGWAIGKGLLPEGAPNPWEAAPAPGKDVPRDRVLNDEELACIWNAAGTLATPYGPMVRFLILTLARREEATAMTWGEVAADLSTWTQPAGRTKNGKPHMVHLTEPARAILRTLLGAEEGKPLPPLPKGDRLVFGLLSNKAVSSHSWVKRELDNAIAEARGKAAAEAGAVAPEPVPHWVLHDFRRSGVTWLAGKGVAPHVADKLLNHTQGTLKGVALIYQKGTFLPEREAALELWASHVTTCAAPSPAAAAVVPPAALAEARAKRARKAAATR
jgi:integrase